MQNSMQEATPALSVEMGLNKIYGFYITAERLAVVKRERRTVSNLWELVMTDFSIENEKDAIKTKPSYPGRCCKQQPNSRPVHNSQAVGSCKFQWESPTFKLPSRVGQKERIC